MKKIINNPADCVPEMVDGLVRTYPQIIEQIPGTKAVVRSEKSASSAAAVPGTSRLMPVSSEKGCSARPFAVKSLRPLPLIRFTKPSKPQTTEPASSWSSKTIPVT